MSKCQYSKALKSFLGYLEGTQKSAHTIKNYRLDLLAFQKFLAAQAGNRPIECENLSSADLDRYHTHLKTADLKTNTRRRKLLTAQHFLRYLSKRKQLVMPIPNKLPAPHKVERIPFTVPRRELIAAIRALPAETPLALRDRAMLWVLAETGCLVSEVSTLQAQDWVEEDSKRVVRFSGKAERSIEVSSELFEEIQSLANSQKWLFAGHNKHGSLGTPMTPRGIELLVRHYAGRIGFDQLTPRTFRHSVAIAWFREGMTQDEVQRRLGLKSKYAFRAYLPILKSETA
jgi:site-specific recombinase XerD